MTASDTDKITWRPPAIDRLLPIVIARRKAMLLGGAIGFLLALAALAATSSRYQINSSLMLQLGREMGAPPTLGETPAMPVQKRPEDLTTAVEMMSGQALLEEVVDSFGEDYFYGRPAPTTVLQKARRFVNDLFQGTSEKASAMWAALIGKRKLTPLQRIVIVAQKDLTIEVARRSDVVDLTYVSTDPDKGREFLKRFIDLYRQAHMRAYQSPKARDFFMAERDRLGKDLTDAEAAMARYKAEHNAFSGEDQLRFLLQQHQGMSTTYAALQADVARVTAQLASLKTALTAQPADLQLQAMKQRNTLLDLLSARLAEAESNKARTHSKYADDSRMAQDADHEVQELHDQITRAEKDAFVTGSVTTGINETRKKLETELLNQQSELDGLLAQTTLKKQQLDDLNAQLRSLDAADAELVRQTREILLLTESYRLYSKHLEDARILDAMDRASISNIAVIEPPTASLVPVYPPAKLWLVGAVILGAGLPLAAGLAADRVRLKVNSQTVTKKAVIEQASAGNIQADRVETFGLPVPSPGTPGEG